MEYSDIKLLLESNNICESIDTQNPILGFSTNFSYSKNNNSSKDFNNNDSYSINMEDNSKDDNLKDDILKDKNGLGFFKST